MLWKQLGAVCRMARSWCVQPSVTIFTGLLVLLLLTLSGCGCLEAGPPIADYRFSVYHPRAVVIYRPVGGSPPAGEVQYIYLAIQDDGPPRSSMCFARWSERQGLWNSSVTGDLVPTVQVVNNGAPIIGLPEVRLQGISGKSLTTGDRFPAVLPDAADFPFNEANYQRNFAISIHPDRAAPQASGTLHVTASLAKAGAPSSAAPAQSVSFDINVELRPTEFRPETMTVDTSEVSR